MKRPEEIKKGMECCFGDNDVRDCEQCPYAKPIPTGTIWDLVTCDDDMEGLCVDALAYIQQLEEKYKHAMENAKILSDAVTQLEAEKNQLLEDLADHCGSKTLCKKYEDGTCPHEYDCTLYLSTCEDYEWRGLPEV